MFDGDGAGPDVVGAAALLVLFVVAHIVFLALVHTFFTVVGAERLVTLQHMEIDGPVDFFPSFLHFRMTALSVTVGAVLAGIAYYDMGKSELAPILAAVIPFPILVADGWRYVESPFFTVVVVQMVLTQYVLTKWWSKGLADRWMLVPQLRHSS